MTSISTGTGRDRPRVSPVEISVTATELVDHREGFPQQKVFLCHVSSAQPITVGGMLEACFARQRTSLCDYDLTAAFDYDRIPLILAADLGRSFQVALFADSGDKWSKIDAVVKPYSDPTTTQHEDLAACGYAPVELEQGLVLILGLLDKLRKKGHVLRDIAQDAKELAGLTKEELAMILCARDRVLRTASNPIRIATDEDATGLVRVGLSKIPLMSDMPAHSSLILGSPKLNP